MLLSAALAVWSVGFAGVVVASWQQWRRIRTTLRQARPIRLDPSCDTRGLTVRSSATALEPGIVGIWRPILLVPDGLLEQLTPAQIDAVCVHERSHVDFHDN